MKAHKYWSLGALLTMFGTFYTGYKGAKSSHKYFAVSSLICMVMAIYSGHKMISGKKKTKKELANAEMNNESTLCPLDTKLSQSLWCQEKSWHLFYVFLHFKK